MSRLDDYRAVAPRGAVDIIVRLAERLAGRRVLHVTAGRFGGGAPEMLATLVPIVADLGLDVSWEITGGDPTFYATARALEAALQGEERALSDEALDHYVEMNRLNAKKLPLDAHVVMVHDAQPGTLVADRVAESHWLWRCHFDCSRATRRAWFFMRRYLGQYDGTVFSLPKFTRRLSIPHYIVHPAIDPLSDKNRELGPNEITRQLEALGVPRDRPLLVQIGPFTRAADPLGVVDAYRLVRKYHHIRLVLAGMAGDDRESLDVLGELREVAEHDHDVIVLELPPEAHRQINALQRAAAIVLHKSLRAGFGLAVAEAMWKGKPVIGGFAGGLPQQIVYDVTGYTVHSVEGAAFRVRYLLNNPEIMARMGAAGREHVRRSFLVTRHLTDYLALLSHVLR